MKKIFALFAALLMLLTLTACELTLTTPTTAPEGPTTTITDPTTAPTEPSVLPTDPSDPIVDPTDPSDPSDIVYPSWDSVIPTLNELGISLSIDYDLDTYIFVIGVNWTNNTESAAAVTDFYTISLIQDGTPLIDCTTTYTEVAPGETDSTDLIFEMMNTSNILIFINCKDGEQITAFEFIIEGAVG